MRNIGVCEETATCSHAILFPILMGTRANPSKRGASAKPLEKELPRALGKRRAKRAASVLSTAACRKIGDCLI